MPRNRIAQAATLILLSAALAIIAGCGGTSSSQEIADTSGWFHVRVPAKWQTTSTSGSILIVAGKDLPTAASDAFSDLSIQIYTSGSPGPDAVAKTLTRLVDARATSRGWSRVSVSSPVKVSIGGREAWAVDVSATDKSKRDFAGRIALVRTNEREALIVALGPTDVWNASGEDAVSNLYSQWYWHNPAKSETTGTPKP